MENIDDPNENNSMNPEEEENKENNEPLEVGNIDILVNNYMISE